MTTPPLTEELVYLTLQGVFVGEHLQLRQAKSIRKAIVKHHFNPDIRALTLKYNIHTISNMAKTLLEDQIFASKTAAKARFPDVFGGPSSQHTQSTTSGSGISTTSSAAAIQPAIPAPQATTSGAASLQRAGVYSPAELLGIGEEMKLKKKKKKLETVDTQNLEFDSISLPLWDHHRILVRVQYTLEKACYNFAQRLLSGLLEREGWDCAEAVELNQWARTLLVYHHELSLDHAKDMTRPLSSLMDSIIQLRHDAVHRVRLSSSALLQHLANAELLARLLQDDTCSRSMSTIRQKTQEAIERLVRNKQLLDGRLADIKREFAAKRAELERQEAALLEAAVNQHEVPMVSASGSLHRLSDNHGGTTEEVHAPWLRVYDSDLPDDGSSGTEDTTSQSLESEATKVIDDDADVISPPPMHPVSIPAVDEALLEPIIHPEQQEAEKNENKRVEVVDVEESELDDHESDQKHPLDPPPLDQDDTATDTEESSEGHGKCLEQAGVSDWEDSKLQDNDEEVFYEPSTSLASTCVDEAVSDALEAHPESPIDDQTRVIDWNPDGSERKRQRIAHHMRNLIL